MRDTTVRRALPLACAIALVTMSADVMGWGSLGYKWASSTVTYYVNPQNAFVSTTAATSSVQAAASVWADQSNANVQLVYGGSTSGSSLALNFKNEVFFRNDAGSAGLTYWYSDGGGNLVDADIVLRGTNTPLTADGYTCTNAIYITDLAAHEFGHVLGLTHSSLGTATMYPTMSAYCDPSWRTLEPDDVTGIEATYPPTSTQQVPAAPSQLNAVRSSGSPTSAIVLSWADNANNENGFRIERSSDGVNFGQIAQLGSNTSAYTNSGLASGVSYFYRVSSYNNAGGSAYSNVSSASTQAQTTTAPPTVTITNPANNAAYPANSAVTFSGSAVDVVDGSLSGSLRWTSSVDGQIGTGASFARALSPGTHTVTAAVTDSLGLTGSNLVTMVVTVSGPTLTVRSYKVKGLAKADLSWRGLTSASVNIYRNNVVVATTANDGAETNPINAKGSGSYTFKVCEAGTTTCTNSVVASF